MHGIVWLLLAAGLAVAEYFTLTLALGLLAASALVAAVVAGFGAPVLIQVLAFGATALLGLLVIRPLSRSRWWTHPLVRDNSDALIGRTAVVLREVTDLQGLVKLGGEEWSARSLDESLIIPAGARVDVMEIDGATAVVYPRELLP